MSSDSAQQSSESTVSQTLALVDSSSQVHLRSEGERLLLILPKSDQTPEATDWSEILEQLKYRLNGGDRFWQSGIGVHLVANDRLLDGRQLQAIAEALSEVDLQLKRVDTSRRQTAVAAVSAGYSVKQSPPISSFSSQPYEPAPSFAEPLYLKTTVRSGVEVRHPGTVVLLGDLNPGGTIIAAGDIIVWGRLRGIAHAGAQGNRAGQIMALQMEPTQLRIADALARAPETPPAQFDPEVAYITPAGIRLTKAIDFHKTHSFSIEVGSWTESN